MKKIILFSFLTMAVHTAIPQTARKKEMLIPELNRPALVVGIVVDQMRYDYLFRYWNKYSEGGFKRLVTKGFNFENANYDYIPTYTAPGHACIYTGTSPSYNGIISNEWYDRDSKKSMYCVFDSTVKSVGTNASTGKMSPRNLYTTTMTDELRLATNLESKVIAIALKDRGAILPGGHMANAAYWHDPNTNNWITSTYYMNELPEWVHRFNDLKMVSTLLSKPWNTLLPIDQYTESTGDDTPYEGLYRAEAKPVFPHNLPILKDSDEELIRRIPFGNTFTKEFAVAALKGENLGKGKNTDFLAVSFSSTDYVGHNFGINAIETEDTYLRLDKDIAEFLSVLDEWTGKNYVLFLTADHGAVQNPEYAKNLRQQAGVIDQKIISDSLKKFLADKYENPDLILNVNATNIYLNRPLIASLKLDLTQIQYQCAQFVIQFNGVSTAITATELAKGIDRIGVYSFMQRGFSSKRSADVMIQLMPGWIDSFYKTGTTHGAGYSYDTHVPVLFFGKDIPHGASVEAVSITDIAPTICSMLKIEFPNGNSGKPLHEVIRLKD